MNRKQPLLVIAFAIGVALRANPALAVGGETTPVVVSRTGEFSFTAPSGEVLRSPGKEFFRFGTIQEPNRKHYAELIDGSRLVLAPSWGRLEPITLEAGRFKLQSMAFGEVAVPRNKVAQIVLSASGDPILLRSVRAGLRDTGPDAVRPDASVWTADGDQLFGSIEKIGGKRLELNAAGQASQWELNQLAVVAFREVTPAEFSPKLALGFEEGSLLLSDEVTRTEKALTVRLSCGVEISSAEPEGLRFAQRLAGDFWPLAEAEVVNYQQTPYLGAGWPLAIDTALDGGPLFAAGGRRLQALTCHSAARIIYRVPQGASRLVGQIALVDGGSPAGSVECAVFSVRDGRLEEAYRSPTLRAGRPPHDFTADLTGAQGVALVTDYADHGDTGDQAAWVDCRFER